MSLNQKFHLWGLFWLLTGLTIASLTKIPVEVVRVEKQVVVEYVLEKSPTCANDRECLILAEAIYHEARGEQPVGQKAVANVILNRVSSPHFPDTIEGVLRQGCQFSYKCDGSAKRGVSDITAFQKAMIIARDVLSGDIPDNTNGADHYLNPKKVKRIPDWTKKYQQVAVMGNHQFHKRG